MKTLYHISLVALSVVHPSLTRTVHAVTIGASRYADFADSPEASFEYHSAESGGALPEDRLPDEYDSKIDGKRVALYDDAGAWKLGVEHHKKLLISAKASYKVLRAKDILAGALNLADFDTLVMPGGKSWIYLDSLGEHGQQAIREFIWNGGSYFGTCAGAFFAVSHRKDSKRDNIPYGIGLLEGTAYDGTALGTAPFKRGMISVDYHLEKFKPHYKVLLLGGPALLYTEEEAIRKNVQVLATFPKFRKPAMITFNYGNGRVAIVGPHGEIEEKKVAAGMKWKDPDSEWPLIRSVIAWLRGGDHPSLR